MSGEFNQVTPTTMKPATSGYGNGDTTGNQVVQHAASSIDKGGMRGLGLIAVAIAEAKLKRDSVELAEDYYDQNKKEFDFFVAVHEPAIAQTVTEAMSSTANPKYQYDLYASVPAGIAKAALADDQWFETRRRLDRYSVGAQKRIDYEFALMRTHGVVAGWNIGTRYEINYADEHNNRRFDRKIAASNIGIGIGNIVRQGLASSISSLASARDSLGDTISTIGNGIAAGGGYKQGREQANQRYASMSDSGVNQSGSGEQQ
jgi:hypothetical protein